MDYQDPEFDRFSMGAYDGNKNIGKEIKCFTNYLKEEIIFSLIF